MFANRVLARYGSGAVSLIHLTNDASGSVLLPRLVDLGPEASRAHSVLAEFVKTFGARDDKLGRDGAAWFNHTVAQLHHLIASVRACELAGVEKTEILQLIEQVIEAYAQSPFIWYIQFWPRGYQGDYLIVSTSLSRRTSRHPARSLGMSNSNACLPPWHSSTATSRSPGRTHPARSSKVPC